MGSGVSTSVLLEKIAAGYDSSLTHKYPGGPPGNEFVFDDPTVVKEETPLIQGVPKCEVRPESVFEINRLRVSAANIKNAITAEVNNMAIRKEFVGQMTEYINDRIIELNAVKRQIGQEEEWLTSSKAKIMYLHATEKIIKTEDIMSCLGRLQANKAQAEVPLEGAVKTLTEQKEELTKEIEEWEKKLKEGAGGEKAA
uniref:Uncharacterized protein n=1 Tax=Lotharella oceanica TaxID=641309 RepID=A0A7S2TF42_9EUKA|eukprot:CAMPEP_0170175254 /NCGR_PEP_ID=MMETSP0040_2-20121228/8359_1 /TAXON_ID=641309 /ORGANISM="Lotharella oceanica, Strain CCMP622" /LENGTH=197 /DNA_ID=CAMNT_0010417171 /DNA_START=1 /DNA_END=594 /DNA_ORIENTATION=-